MSRAGADVQADFGEAGGLTIHTRGLPPLDEPLLAAAIESRLAEQRQDRSLAADTRLRCSDAYACARKIAFSSLGVPKDVAYSRESLIAFRAGDAYHQIAQEAAVQWFDARCEYPIDWSPDLSLSGHADGFYIDGEHRVCMEIKSMAGYGFRLAVGHGKDDAGPKIDHLIQAGLYALSPQIRADQLHILYIDKDRNLTAEWVIGIDDPLPHLGGVTVRQLVDEEIARLRRILHLIDVGDLPAREVPGFGLVEGDPPAANSRDNPWNCRYCAWQPTCAGLPAGPVDGGVEVVLSRKEAS